jgi:molybdopterin molybdotransferase
MKAYPIVPDSLEDTRRALQQAFQECDFVVTSGGVSVGELDYVKPAFELCGGQLDFWRISMKPGKPFACGTLANKLLFGLPGNPVSAFVTFLLLVRPALLRAQGATETGVRSISGPCAERFTNSGDRRHFLRVAMNSQGVFSAGTQASHMLSSLAAAEGLLDLPPKSTIEPGRTVSVLLWD